MYDNTVATDVFNLMPCLVIDYVGQPGIITAVSRDMEEELVTFTVNTADGDVVVVRSWGKGDTVTLIGLAVDCQPDNIDLFNS